MEADDVTVSQCVEMYAPARDDRGDAILEECASFPPSATVGRIGCPECAGTGWWGYGPVEEVNGPCIVCKGTGRVWVGLG